MLEMPRTTPKAVWKYYYRQYRIIIREARKTVSSAVVYGSGALYVGDDGDVAHVPIQDLMK